MAKQSKNVTKTKTTKLAKPVATKSKITKKACAKQKCPVACRTAIIVVIVSAIIFITVLIFAIIVKGKKQVLSCDLTRGGEGSKTHVEYSYEYGANRPYNVYEKIYATALSTEEAEVSAQLLSVNEDELYVTIKAWNENEKFFVESNRNEKQIKVALEDDETAFTSLDKTKSNLEEYGYICTVE